MDSHTAGRPRCDAFDSKRVAEKKADRSTEKSFRADKNDNEHAEKAAVLAIQNHGRCS